jgi:GNAT superfamily N-acetyltransferase
MSAHPLARLLPSLLRELPRDDKHAFYAWVEAMTPEADHEDGPGFAAWLREHEATPGDTTWVFADGATGDLLGTASLVKRDRDADAEPGGWVIGGVNVARERRGQGVGRVIMRFLEGELQRRSAEVGHAVPVKLVAAYPPAIHLYESFGFRRVPGSDVFTRMFGATR